MLLFICVYLSLSFNCQFFVLLLKKQPENVSFRAKMNEEKLYRRKKEVQVTELRFYDYKTIPTNNITAGMLELQSPKSPHPLFCFVN